MRVLAQTRFNPRTSYIQTTELYRYRRVSERLWTISPPRLVYLYLSEQRFDVSGGASNRVTGLGTVPRFSCHVKDNERQGKVSCNRLINWSFPDGHGTRSDNTVVITGMY